MTDNKLLPQNRTHLPFKHGVYSDEALEDFKQSIRDMISSAKQNYLSILVPEQLEYDYWEPVVKEIESLGWYYSSDVAYDGLFGTRTIVYLWCNRNQPSWLLQGIEKEYNEKNK